MVVLVMVVEEEDEENKDEEVFLVALVVEERYKCSKTVGAARFSGVDELCLAGTALSIV